MDVRKMALAAAALGGALMIYLLSLWHPLRQVRLHQVHLLRAIEKRDFERAAEFLADNYSDRWGHDKANALSNAQMVFRHFFTVSIKPDERIADVAGGKGKIASVIIITGNGSAVAHLAMDRVNSLGEPFIFEWQQQSWKPWDWQLVRVDHPTLEIGRVEGFGL